jgi:hypothetical protein
MRCELCPGAAAVVATVPRPRGITDRYRLCRVCAVASRSQIEAAGGHMPDLPTPEPREDPPPNASCYHCGAGVRGGLPLCGRCSEALRASVAHHRAGRRVGGQGLGAQAALALPAEVAERWGPAGLCELRAALRRRA